VHYFSCLIVYEKGPKNPTPVWELNERCLLLSVSLDLDEMYRCTQHTSHDHVILPPTPRRGTPDTLHMHVDCLSALLLRPSGTPDTLHA